MKKFAVAAALLSATIAAPAMAQDSGEARVQVHGGYITGGGLSDATVGVAAGYDFNFGNTFAGPEIAGNKILASHNVVEFSAGGRAGARISDTGKLYAAAGYTFGTIDNAYIGAGYEQKLSPTTFIKGEYRHQFISNWGNSNSFLAGVGMNF